MAVLRRNFRADVAEVADVATLRAGHLPAVLRLTLMAMAVNGATAVIICGVRWAQVSLRSMLTWAMVIPSRAGLGGRGGGGGWVAGWVAVSTTLPGPLFDGLGRGGAVLCRRVSTGRVCADGFGLSHRPWQPAGRGPGAG